MQPVDQSPPILKAGQDLSQKAHFLWNSRVITSYKASSSPVGEWFRSIFRDLDPFNLYVKRGDTVYKMSKSELKSAENKNDVKRLLQAAADRRTAATFLSIVMKKNVPLQGKVRIDTTQVPDEIKTNKNFKKEIFDLFANSSVTAKRFIVDEGSNTYSLYELSINRASGRPEANCKKLFQETDVRSESGFQEKCRTFESLRKAVVDRKLVAGFFDCGGINYLITAGEPPEPVNLTLVEARLVPGDIVTTPTGCYGMCSAAQGKIHVFKLEGLGGIDLQADKELLKKLITDVSRAGEGASVTVFSYGEKSQMVSCTKNGGILSFTVVSPKISCKDSKYKKYFDELPVPDKNVLLQEAFTNAQKEAWGGRVFGADFLMISCSFDKKDNSFSFAFSSPSIAFPDPSLKEYFDKLPYKNDLLQQAYANKPQQATDGLFVVEWKTDRFEISKKEQPVVIREQDTSILKADENKMILEANTSINGLCRKVLVDADNEEKILVSCQKKRSDNSFVFSSEPITVQDVIVKEEFWGAQPLELIVEADANSDKTSQTVIISQGHAWYINCKKEQDKPYTFTRERIKINKNLFIPDVQVVADLITKAIKNNGVSGIIVPEQNVFLSCTKKENGSFTFVNKEVKKKYSIEPGLDTKHTNIEQSAKRIPEYTLGQLLVAAHQKGRADIFVPSTLTNGTVNALHIEIIKKQDAEYDIVVKEPVVKHMDPLSEEIFLEEECKPAFFNMMVQLGTGASIEKMVTYKASNYVIACTKSEADGSVSFAAQKYAEELTLVNVERGFENREDILRLIARAYNGEKVREMVNVEGRNRPVVVEKDATGHLQLHLT